MSKGIIRLTEDEFHRVLGESVKILLKESLLIESQESKSIAQAKRLVIDRLGYDESEADEFVRVKLRSDLPVLRTPQGGKFILGVTRMFLDGELRSAQDITSLNATLKLVASDAHINEYDRNLNGMSCRDLISKFSKAMTNNLERDKDDISKLSFKGASNYNVVRIDSFEDASNYGRYVSWCVTHDEGMFDSYTSNGVNQFYFCLRNGFKGVKEVPGKGCPLDDYGLSMIAVSVTENGMLNTCTCRWNHDNGGNDNIMDTKEISEVIGARFYDVFKPNNKFKEAVNNAIARVRNGESPKDVFGYVGDFIEGFTIVRLNGRQNFIDKNGNFLSDQWFDGAYDFREGFARVRLNDKWNFVDRNGNFLSDRWLESVNDFSEGFAAVRLNGKWNFIGGNGRLISKQWFDGTDDFREGFARVLLNGKYNFIDRNGSLLSDQGFDYSVNFNDGFARVELNGKLNYIDRNGNFLSDRWFDDTCGFSEGFARVELNGEMNFIDRNGDFLSDQWFDYADDFSEGFASVGLNGEWNFIDRNGRFLSQQWFDYAYDFSEGFGIVRLNRRRNFIDKNGNFLSDQWFDGACGFREGFARVGLNGKWNFVDKNGNLLSDRWFDWVGDFREGFASVILNGKSYIINTSGEITVF